MRQIMVMLPGGVDGDQPDAEGGGEGEGTDDGFHVLSAAFCWGLVREGGGMENDQPADSREGPGVAASVRGVGLKGVEISPHNV